MGLFDGFNIEDTVKLKDDLRPVYGNLVNRSGIISSINISGKAPETSDEIMKIFNPGNLPISRPGIYKIAAIRWDDGNYSHFELKYLEKSILSFKQTYNKDESIS